MQMENLTKLDEVIHDFNDHLPINRLPNWLTDSHDLPRVSSRFGVDAVDAFHMLSLLLPGSACVYYGSEIGLENSLVRVDQKMDAALKYRPDLDRDQSRGPMPWDDTKNGGFTKNDKPWLPLSARYWYTNVERQLKEPNSHLKIFKRLMALRRRPVLKNGDLKTYIVNNWTYLFTRSANNETIAVVINLGSESGKICSGDSNFGLPQTMYVHTGSLNSGFKIGDKVTVVSSKGHDCTELRPKAGLVLTTYATAAAVARGIGFWLLMLALGMNILFREGIC
nr:PREDICTED: maltase A1-like [Bemisia tabaci]